MPRLYERPVVKAAGLFHFVDRKDAKIRCAERITEKLAVTPSVISVQVKKKAPLVDLMPALKPDLPVM